MSEGEPKKRRGRPRVSEDERKRHTLTFRMRGDLREAVEELAQANGRTLSEQVEYYVDAAVFTEAGRIYQYSTDAMSPTLHRCITSRERKEDTGGFQVDFPAEHREMLTFAGTNILNTPSALPTLPWVDEPGGAEAAAQMARLFLAAAQRGAIEALKETLGPAVVASLQVGDMLKQVEPGAAPAAYVFCSSSSEDELHLSALVELVDRLIETPPDVDMLCAATWPRRFADLPGDTRVGLINALREDAPGIYENLMRPIGRPDSSGQVRFHPSDQGAKAALQRLQDAFRQQRSESDALELDEGSTGMSEGIRARR